MKMEVLTRNQFQAAHYDLAGTTKVTDWVKPLTPPGSAIIHPTAKSAAATKRHHNHHHHQINSRHYQQQQQLQQQQQQQQPQEETDADLDLYASALNQSAISDDDAAAQLALRLQAELRTAKSRHLACTEVLLPADLLNRVATDMVDMSEKEPCGIRGCSVYIEFEDEPGNSRRIASLEVGESTVPTFELYLTLRHDQTGWTAKLPQFLKNLARRSTIIISPEYTLTKNKLYNTFLE